jgi:CRP-like cAMP-binding protein
MGSRTLGKDFEDGQPIVRQDEVGDCMHVIQEGRAEVIREEDGRETRLAILESGDFFGEMAIFERERRAATVRAVGRARVLTIDKKTFLRQIQSDPSLALEIVRVMSRRIRRLNQEVVRGRHDYAGSASEESGSQGNQLEGHP